MNLTLSPVAQALETAHQSFARHQSGQSDLRTLLRDLETVIELNEQARLENPENPTDPRFLGRYDLYETATALAYSLGRDEAAMQFAEKARARTLLDRTLNKTSFPADRGAESQLVEQEAQARRHVRELADELQREQHQERLASSEEAVARIEESLATARQKLLSLQKQIRQQDPAFAALRGVTPATADDLKARLDDVTAVLSYTLTEERLIIFGITSQGLFSEHVNIPQSQFSEWINQYRARIEQFRHTNRDIQFLDQQPVTDQNLAVEDHSLEDPELDKLAQQLYDVLIRPVLGHLNGIQRLALIPDGDLHRLPFAALHSKTQYLVEQFTIYYAPSMSMLQVCLERERPSGNRLLVFGNPDLQNPEWDLPYAEQESRALAEKHHGTSFLRHQATREELLKCWHACDFLHFACHAVWDEDHPEFSAILLAPTERESGRLEVHELFALNEELPLSLVTLSACGSSLGAGSDLTGLATGFLYAGAAAVIGSLWSVEDLSTHELMLSFYQRLQEENRATALREAQLELLSRKPTAHPFFWAAFQLTGNPLGGRAASPGEAAFSLMHRWRYEDPQGSLLHPVLAEDRIVVSRREKTSDGQPTETIQALAISDRSLLWESDRSGLCHTFVNGVVHVSGEHADFALDARTGRQIWTRETGNPFPSQFGWNGRHLISGGHRTSVAALDPLTGATLWEHQLPRDGSGGFLVQGDRVFVGCNDRHLYCLHAGSGARLWQRDLGWDEWKDGAAWVRENKLWTKIGSFEIATGQWQSEETADLSDWISKPWDFDRVQHLPPQTLLESEDVLLYRDDPLTFFCRKGSEASDSSALFVLHLFDTVQRRLLRRFRLNARQILGWVRTGEGTLVGGDGALHWFSAKLPSQSGGPR